MAAALGAAVHELRFVFCQTSAASEATRNFVLANYKALKGANPTTPILIREAAGVEPKLTARFAAGVEKTVSLAGMDETAVGKALTALAKKR